MLIIRRKVGTRLRLTTPFGTGTLAIRRIRANSVELALDLPDDIRVTREDEHAYVDDDTVAGPAIPSID